jgi:hypothetical protein
MKKVLILGGYGNFGKRIARALTGKGIAVIVAGRSREKAQAFVNTLQSSFAEAAALDVTLDFDSRLLSLRPAIVINTCGPFQTRNYDVARACIAAGVHYIDLADGREFVVGITVLDADAKAKGVTVVSGASTVPGLSSAVVQRYRDEFSAIESLVFGISPGQQAERGRATAQAILSYVGKALKAVPGDTRTRYGWQDIYRQSYPVIGKRWMANCDIPDLDLLPLRYGIRSIRFSAGLELGFMHLGLWTLSWLVRLGAPLNLPRHAALLLKLSSRFDRLGTADGGMHMILRGKDTQARAYERQWFVIAKHGDGPQIPCIPAILLTKKLLSAETMPAGAYPCVGLITLDEYMRELQPFSIEQITV